MTKDPTPDLFQTDSVEPAPALQSLWTRKRDGRTVRVIRFDDEGRVLYWTLGPITDAGYAREIKGEGSALASAWHELFSANERAEMLELAGMAHAAFSYLALTTSDCDRPQFRARAERAWGVICHARHDLPA